MILKRLWILGVLAVCLFAMTMAMVGSDEPPPDKPQ